MNRAPASRKRCPQVFRTGGGSLLDLLDHVINQGVVLGGELVLGLANVDLVYARLWVLLCAADRVLPTAAKDFAEHSHGRRTPRYGRASP
jgi:hypothetical protein